jgi:hypothetical protein
VNRRIRIDLRLASAGILAIVTALTVLLVTAGDPKVEIAVAAEPMASGRPVAELSFKSRPVLDSTGLIESDHLVELSDHVLAVPLEQGDPLFRSALVAPDTGHHVDLLGLDLRPAAAVQGHLIAGDVIDVYAVDPFELLVTDVPVVMATTDEGSLGGGDVQLLLAVDDETATVLVAASAGELHLVRKGG